MGQIWARKQQRQNKSQFADNVYALVICWDWFWNKFIQTWLVNIGRSRKHNLYVPNFQKIDWPWFLSLATCWALDCPLRTRGPESKMPGGSWLVCFLTTVPRGIFFQTKNTAFVCACIFWWDRDHKPHLKISPTQMDNSFEIVDFVNLAISACKKWYAGPQRSTRQETWVV